MEFEPGQRAPFDRLLDALPHRPPFRFITSITAVDPGASGEATWRVAGDEWFLQGHFPGRPIVPGVLITEALAQLGGLVVAAADDPATPPSAPRPGALAHADIRFDRPITPPAEIQLHATLTRTLGALHQLEVSATCAGAVAARGMLTLSITPPAPGTAGG